MGYVVFQTSSPPRRGSRRPLRNLVPRFRGDDGNGAFFTVGLLLLTVMVSGCATLPQPERPRAVDPHPLLTLERFHADQQRRLDRLHQWQVAGILEVTTDRGSRRLRTEIQGETAHRAKVTLFGLMQQVVGVLFADSEVIRMVDADKQQIVEVPANAAGLRHLIGIDLPPEELFESMIALANPEVEHEASPSAIWLTRLGERLILDPETGLIQERSGQTESGGSYRVIYEWPERQNDLSLPMPSRIQVTMQPGESQVHYTARQWRILDKPFATNWFSVLERYAGFAVERPFQGTP